MVNMKKLKYLMCLLLMAILYVFFFPSGSASAKSSDAVPVLLDTTKVTGEPIAKKTSQQSLELWHYSGGYWGFTLGGIEYRIYDSAMKSNWNSADALVNELMRNNQFKEKVRFEFSVPENVKQYLKSGRNVKLLLKKADGSNIDLKQIFKTDGDAIPKYEFSKDYSTVYLYTWPKFKFNGLYGESVSGLTGRNNNIPKVHPTYGYNVYAIWKNGSSIGYAKGNSLYQRNDASNSVYYPQRKGDLAYEFIKDDIGRLKTEGGYDKILVFDKNGEKWYNIGSGSNDVRIGWYTFKDVGAVGIHLWYPVQLEFYPEKDGNITADLIAAAEPDIVLPPNQTQDIEVTLDSSASEAFLEGEPVEITSRRYWASTGSITGEGEVSVDSTHKITVKNVRPNSWIRCKVRVYSKALQDAGVTCVAEKTVDIYVRGYNSQPGTGKAIIAADNRGSEKFNVLEGIPSSESQYVNVIDKEYYFNYTDPIERKGNKRYSIPVSKTYTLTWEVDEGETCHHTDENGSHSGCHWVSNWVTHSESKTITKNYTVTRDYSYWIIDRLEVFGLERAEVQNETLPEEGIVLEPKGYEKPKVDVWHSDEESDHIIEPAHGPVNLGSETISGGRSGKPSYPNPDWRKEAEDSVKEILVKNDLLNFKGIKVIDGGTYETDTPDPIDFPRSNDISSDVLYEKGLKIDDLMPNDTYESTAFIYYNKYVDVNGEDEDFKVFDLAVNNVTVHTPVVCYAQVSNDASFNQEVKPDPSRTSLILDRSAKITLPTSGMHRAITGYGNKDYAKYTKGKYIRFPFDVYLGTNKNGEFLAYEGEWYEIPKEQETLDLYVPTWVKEGNYDIEFCEIAINGPEIDEIDESIMQDSANLDIDKYVASKTIPVRVIGRLYGLRITDINDYPEWEKVFRTEQGSTKHSSSYYWVGLNDQNNNKVRDNKVYTFPIVNGSNPSVKGFGALKTGYRFRFELSTIGSYTEEKDCINIKPRFYYVPASGDPDGTKRQEVDIWYNERFDNKDNYFVKIGSELDNKNTKYIKLADAYRNVPLKDISSTADILGISETQFKNATAKLGWFHNIVLSKPLRTFVGDSSDVPSEVGGGEEDPEVLARKSVQKWYGEYYLPDTLFAVPKGFDIIEKSRKKGGLDGSEDFWLKDGYIIVNFQIETVKDGAFSEPILSYWNSPLCNMWQVEGGVDSRTDFGGSKFKIEPGDMVFYYTNHKSSDDYSQGGPQ